MDVMELMIGDWVENTYHGRIELMGRYDSPKEFYEKVLEKL